MSHWIPEGEQDFFSSAISDGFADTERRLQSTQYQTNPNALSGTGWVELSKMPTMRLQVVEQFEDASSLTAAQREHNRQEQLKFISDPANYANVGQGVHEQPKDFRFIYRLESEYITDQGDTLRLTDFIEYFASTGEARWVHFDGQQDTRSSSRHPELYFGYAGIKGPDYYNWVGALRGMLGEPKDLLPEIKIDMLEQGDPNEYITTSHNTFVAVRSKGMFRGSRLLHNKQYDAYILPTDDGQFWAMDFNMEGFGLSSFKNYINPEGRKMRVFNTLKQAVNFISSSPAADQLIRDVNRFYGTSYRPKRSVLSL